MSLLRIIRFSVGLSIENHGGGNSVLHHSEKIAKEIKGNFLYFYFGFFYCHHFLNETKVELFLKVAKQ